MAIQKMYTATHENLREGEALSSTVSGKMSCIHAQCTESVLMLKQIESHSCRRHQVIFLFRKGRQTTTLI